MGEYRIATKESAMNVFDIALVLYLPLLAVVALWLYGLPKNDEAANPWTDESGFAHDQTTKEIA